MSVATVGASSRSWGGDRDVGTRLTGGAIMSIVYHRNTLWASTLH